MTIPKSRSKSQSNGNTSLRRGAEKRLPDQVKRTLPPNYSKDADALVHELQVHQIELETQNEELRRAQLEIEESRARYIDLYDFAPVGYLTFDDKGLISELNLPAAQLLGIERKWLINKPFSLFLESESQDTFHLHRREVLESSTRQTCELVLKRRDKTFFNIQLESIAVQVNGYPAVRSILTDITERERAKEMLRASEERYRSYIEVTGQLGWTTDVNGEVVEDLPSWRRVTGQSDEETRGTGWVRALHPDDVEHTLQVWNKAVINKTAYEVEYRIRRHDGLYRLFLARGVPVLKPDGSVREWVGTCIDITERKAAEEVLQKSEEWLRQFFESIPDYCYLASPEGQITDVNLAALEALGYTREELVGQPIETIYAPRSHQKMAQLFKRWPGTGVLRNEEMTVRTKQGEERTVLLNVGSMRDGDGRILHSTSIQTDITERRKLEEKQKRLEDQIHQSQKMEAIGTLAGGIAHDFNNILAAIIGFAEMIGEDAIPGSSEQRRAELVQKAAFRGRDLVKQILTFSRQTGHEKEPVALRDVVEEVLKLLRPAIPSTIAIETRISTVESVILADSVRMHQILMNLCTNAAHAMREKGGLLEIGLEDASFSTGSPMPDPCIKSTQYIKLSVRDTGHGMETEILKQIFDPFFTTKAPGEGTGLGLSVVHGIVRDHDGCVLVDSKPGKGSTFYVYLPKLKEHVATESKGTGVTPRGSERILFVDDEEMMADLNKERLRNLGYKVVACTSSTKALDIFRARPDRFDLVITDYTMPNLTGIDLAGQLFKIRPDIPIILYTGQSDTALHERAKKAGIRQFLMKPLAKQELAQAVRRVLDAKKGEC